MGQLCSAIKPKRDYQYDNVSSTNLSPSTQDTPTNQGEYIVAWITTSTFYKIETVTTCQVNGQELHSTKVAYCGDHVELHKQEGHNGPQNRWTIRLD